MYQCNGPNKSRVHEDNGDRARCWKHEQRNKRRAAHKVARRRRAVYYAVSSETSRNQLSLSSRPAISSSLAMRARKPHSLGSKKPHSSWTGGALRGRVDRRGVTTLTVPPTLTETATGTLTAGI